ncbi:hypothetical protein MSG28_011471 [Choristoneura fumiferana]|uniref:Uncharacterized protein n=1 Tax=Choristoneura fumiferana TaxID=7141 RepID=A0ACC0JNJ2_CHOFU|nr:hypothetical protein MSG28_011471 [Choristoneura fumiferana]
MAILNCLLARQLCFEDASCSAILEIIPRVCGSELAKARGNEISHINFKKLRGETRARTHDPPLERLGQTTSPPRLQFSLHTEKAANGYEWRT